MYRPPPLQYQRAPSGGEYAPIDPNAPRMAIPGSSYVPDYGQEPLGSPYYDPPPPPPPAAWDRPVQEGSTPIQALPAPTGGSGDAVPLPMPGYERPPLDDPRFGMSAFMYGVPPRAEWPLYVKRGR
jgi:hypothetical protein